MTNTATKTVSFHETLMNRAYDKYKGHNDWDNEMFLDHCDPAERFAVVLGNFNYQVENGGFIQWWDNRYGTPRTVAELQRYLTQIGTDSAKKALELVTSFNRKIRDADPRNTRFDEGEWERVSINISKLDTQYYAFNAELMVEVEAFIAKTFKV
jgi:hypothetical protein